MLAIHTKDAPEVIGCYSQAILVDNTVYISGQIPLNPITMQLCEGDFRAQLQQIFNNLSAICIKAGGNLAHIVKLTIYLTDLNNFSILNEVMAEYFTAPYPARAVVGVMALPKNATVEIDAILALSKINC